MSYSHHRFCLFLATILAATSSVRAASFDCRVVKSPQEKAICASPSLRELDDQLAAAYKSQLDSVPESMRSEFRNDERSFLQTIAMGCAGKDESSKVVSCMEPQYTDRIATLQKSKITLGGQTFVNRSLHLIGKNGGEGSSEYEANPGYGTLTATWPQSTNSSPAWTAWNAAITRAVQQEANPDSNGDKLIRAKTTAWKDKWASDTESDITAKLILITDSLISARIENDSLGHGAAHPNEGWIYFHWLLIQKRELSNEDIFKSDSEWHSFLAAKCLAALKRQNAKQDFLYDPSQVAGGIADALGTPRNWRLKPTGLTIVFPEYSVSPRTAPAEDVSVPWSDLQPYLLPSFTPPR